MTVGIAHSMPPVITLDGPSGTGKGTLCHRLANILGWHVLDSGAIYRALAVAVMQENAKDMPQWVLLAQNLPLEFVIDAKHQQSLYLRGQDITTLVRTEAVGQEASKLAALPEVRAALLQRQRDFAQMPGLVTDGRDMGTVVFPEAILKIYLDATHEERALRRYLQLQQQGLALDLETIRAELIIRDQRDVSRSNSPLIPAADAVHIDTTGLSVVQVLESILQLIADRGIY